ncbi:MAG TPA: hypothetical protein VER58_04715 [Thermoanaerobaculia bacterium]|nr:hypothetical protein [Thermoanaerobaculia bacterium]
MNRSSLRVVAMVIAAAVIGALVMYVIVRPRNEAAPDTAPPQRVTVENGEPTIAVDAETQQKIGLATAPVVGSQHTEELQLFGNVVDVQELATLENQLATARGQAEQARAKATFDRAELSRLRALNADNKNVSDRAVQEATSVVAADDAALAAASAAMQAAMSSATQRFGPVIAKALNSRSALYQNLISLREMLVQIALLPGTPPPQTLSVVAGDGSSVRARLLSVAPRVDPRLQGTSYFYVAPGGKLAAGMNVTAHFAGSRAADGAVVPSDAVVAFEGKSWVYVRRDATHFVRREISIASPSQSGFFVTNIEAGTPVVMNGAQQLLSEEMRAQLHEA